MGLFVAVFLPEYEEWVRCWTVTPTANGRDFTCTLIDFGHKKNVKVENACFLHKQFAEYPRLSRDCCLAGIKPFIGSSFSSEAVEEMKKFYFGTDGNEDDPSEEVKLAVCFLEMRDQRGKTRFIVSEIDEKLSLCQNCRFEQG